MAIRRMISRSLEEFREFQTRSVEVGRIRIGQYTVPEGKKGRPVKLDRFRLTSVTEDHIRVAAEEYGGEARPYQPQGGGTRQWEVVTETNALDVWIINGQLIDPVYEAWGSGRTCIRRCDGEWNTVLQEPCLCNDPERRPADPRQLCKITTRVNVMLPKVAGLHSWRLETHSENAAVEMASPSVGGLVRAAEVPVPATLRLRREMRRERNHEKQTFETKEFFVPWFDLSRIGAQALAAGGAAATEALTAAGAPALLSSQRPAIEAGPVSAVPVSAPRAPRPPAPADPGPDEPRLAPGEPDPCGGVRLDRAAYGGLMQAIEAAQTLQRLDELRGKMAARNVHYKTIKEAWASKRAAITAAEALNRALDTADDLNAEEPYLDLDPGTMAAQLLHQADADPHQDAVEAAAEATLGAETVDGEVEGDGLPMLPAGEYPVEVELPRLMAAAGKLDPPWTTDQVRAAVVGAFQLGHVGEASGEQFARIRLALEQGILQ